MNNGTNVWSSSYGFKIDYICNYSVFNIGNQGNGTLSNQFQCVAAFKTLMYPFMKYKEMK